MPITMTLGCSLLLTSIFVNAVAIGVPYGEPITHTQDACADNDRTTQGGLLFQRHDSVLHASLSLREESDIDKCDESQWPDKDHNLVCSDCKVLVDRFQSVYGTCDSYCSQLGRTCKGAWEEENDDCEVKQVLRCDEAIASSDAICECSSDESSTGGGVDDNCWGEFSNVVEDEGQGVGEAVATSSVDECKARCNENAECKSFSLCPQWGTCFMKNLELTGSEATKSLETCQTVYKKSCSGGPPAVENKIKVASYNLYWWNAFGENAWKGEHITDNIKNNLQADVLGLQECDSPSLIQSQTGYVPVSDFQGAQGVVVKPGEFEVLEKGHRDIDAAGKWGARYVTWVRLSHSSGRKFWHFNTHWCVHSGNGRTCSANKRYVGAQNMLAVIREKAGSEPVIITGDFNAGMGEAGPQHFLQNGFSMAINNWVDAIFYSTAHWQKGWTGKGDPAHSDHPPVIAELEF